MKDTMDKTLFVIATWDMSRMDVYRRVGDYQGMKLWAMPFYLAGQPITEARIPSAAATTINHTELMR